jgi:DNA-binding NtrC family response regulator
VSEQIAPEVLSLLENYSWPGNVRELENAIERAVVIAPGDEVTRECLRPEIADPQAARAVVRESAGASAALDVGRGINFYEEVRRFEIDLIRRALDQTGGHQSRAARLLGMNPTTLNSKIKTYNINLRP